MRILHLSTLYPPHIVGGAEKSVELLAEAQVALGHTVGAACIEREAVPREMRNGVTVYRMAHGNDFWLEDVEQHSRFERTKAKLKQPFNRVLADQFRAVLEDFKPDVLHTHSMVEITSLVWSEAERLGVPVVHTVRDYEMLCTNSGMFKNGRPCGSRHTKCKILTLDKLYRHRAIRAVGSVGTEILQVHVDEGYFSHIPPERRRVVWNAAVVKGAAVDYVKPRLDGPITFGYLGRISEEKGVDTLLKAAQRVNAPFKVLVAGTAMGSLKPFEDMAAGLPVTFAGFMDPRDFFEAIDVLVVPSLWAEPLPRTILESYAMGVPALGARSGGIPELIGYDNDAWLYVTGDDQALGERMDAVIAAGRDALPTRADFVRVLTETGKERVAQKYLDLYGAALG